MGRCKWCDRKGFFVFIDSDGLCKNCSFIIRSEVNSKFEVIQESQKIINKSKNLETVNSRKDIVLQYLNDCLRFENKGLQIFNFLISDVIQEFKNEYNKRIIELYSIQFVKAKEKILKLKTEKAKENALKKFSILSDKHKEYLLVDADNINECQTEISNNIKSLGI